LNEENLAQVKSLEEEALQQIRAAIDKNPGLIAALIIEPIQGEGGDNHFRPEFMKALREICDQEEIMFVMDEVQTGVGLTGKFWAHEHYGVIPDLIAFGKKTQVCGFMSTDRLNEVEKNVFHESSRINSTWGGNIVDMTRFLMYLEIIEEENLVAHAAKQGEYLLQQLQAFQDTHGDLISNTRGKGLMCAFDLPEAATRDKLMKAMWKEGALILGSGTNSIRFRPHLNVTNEEIDTGLEIIEGALKKL